MVLGESDNGEVGIHDKILDHLSEQIFVSKAVSAALILWD